MNNFMTAREANKMTEDKKSDLMESRLYNIECAIRTAAEKCQYMTTSFVEKPIYDDVIKYLKMLGYTINLDKDSVIVTRQWGKKICSPKFDVTGLTMIDIRW